MRIFSSDVLPMPKCKPPRMDLRYTKNKSKNETPDGPDAPDTPSPADILHPMAAYLTGEYDYVTPFGQDVTHAGLDLTTNRNEPPLNELRVKKIHTPKVKVSFNPNEWVFTQATAVASVNLEKSPKWQVTSDTIKYVNNNGNAWSSELIKNTFRSFQGAMNLKDHISPQEGGKIYGIIIDAVLRRMNVRESGFIYYVDTLIATHRATDPEWAQAIEDGKIRYLSVGFDCDFVRCSLCGHVYQSDGTGACQHQLDRGKIYFDANGRKSRIAEMPTDANGAGVCYFAELSYLAVDPAFTGATQGHVFTPTPEQLKKPLSVVMNTETLLREAMIHFEKHYKVMPYEEVQTDGNAIT